MTTSSLNKEKYWIICPVYNDIPSFLQLRHDTLATLSSESINFIFVDDSAGKDPLLPEIKLLSDTTILQTPLPNGHQKAIVHGIRSILPTVSPSDWIITMDADGEDKPSDIQKLIGGYQQIVDPNSPVTEIIVVAERTNRSAGFFFTIGYFCFKVIFYILSGLHITSGNFALYKASTAQKIASHKNFDTCYSSSILASPISFHKVPCERGIRYQGKSKMNYYSLVRHGIIMFTPFKQIVILRLVIIGILVMCVVLLKL